MGPPQCILVLGDQSYDLNLGPAEELCLRREPGLHGVSARVEGRLSHQLTGVAVVDDQEVRHESMVIATAKDLALLAHISEVMQILLQVL